MIVKEAYAIIYALKKLRSYLWGATFEILTDHKPLKSLFADEIANTKIQRWAIQISEFGAPIRYKCGKDNARADMLSRARIPTPLPVLVVEWDLPLTFDNITKEELIKQQQQHFSDLLKSASTEGTYALLDGILVSTKKPSLEHVKHPSVVLPPSFRKTVICNRHEQSGHAAVERTMFHIAQSYVWPGMYREIKTQLEKCGVCRLYQERKPHVHTHEMPTVHYPHQVVAMDLVGPLPRSRGGHVFLLTFIDHLTGWADAFPLTIKSGDKIVNVLKQHYLPQYGLPEAVLSDNGTEFCNTSVESLFRRYGIKHLKSSPYHPQSNGKIERFHRTLKATLKKFVTGRGSTWLEQVGPAFMAYRNTLHSSVGMSPFQALYGRVNRLPCQNSKFPTCATKDEDRIQTLISTWDNIKQTTAYTSDKNITRSKRRKDAESLQTGTSVMVLRPGTVAGMAPKWVPRWIVIRLRHPSYWIRHTPTGVEKVIHRSRIQPVPLDTHWPDEIDDDPGVVDGSSVPVQNTPTPLPSSQTEPVGRSLEPVPQPPLQLGTPHSPPLEADMTPPPQSITDTRDIQLIPTASEPQTPGPTQSDTSSQPPIRMVFSRAATRGPVTRSTPYIVKSSTSEGDAEH